MPPKIHLRCFQKVHQFQQSVEEVMHRLSEAERNGGFLSNRGVSAKTETDINNFRNQLKASSSFDPSPFYERVPKGRANLWMIIGFFQQNLVNTCRYDLFDTIKCC